MPMIDMNPGDVPGLLSGPGEPLLVFFHKEGCSSCVAVAAETERISRQFPSLKVVRVDSTHTWEGIQGYVQGGTPLVVLFAADGLEHWRWRGGSVTAERMVPMVTELTA